MSDFVQFSVGDRVVCVEGFERGFTGGEGVVTGISKSISDNEVTVLHVKFDNCKHIKEWYSHRFIHVDPAIASLSPVCRKIRVMEDRWKKFQENKNNPKEQDFFANLTTISTFTHYGPISNSW